MVYLCRKDGGGDGNGDALTTACCKGMPTALGSGGQRSGSGSRGNEVVHCLPSRIFLNIANVFLS